MVKNLNSTNVGLERLSAFLNNIPFAGDELQAIKNKYTDFNELIYKLTQGEGKSRGTVDGGIAEQLKWNCAYLTTGEEPITSDFSKEGVKNRVIEIEENEQLVENGKEIVNTLIENYGFAGKIFLEKLPTQENLQRRHNEIFKELENKYKSTGKQTNAIATILLADEIASKYIFEDDALTIDQAEKYFSKNIDEADRYINLIIDTANANINNFYDKSSQFPPSGQIWGLLEKTTDGNGEIMYYDFIPTKLYQILEDNGINWNGIKKKLVDKGYLKVDRLGKYQINTKINGTQQRTIKIKNIYFDM